MLASGMSLEDFISSGGNVLNLPNAWLSLVVAQGISSLLAFIGTGWFYWRIIEKKSWKLLCNKPLPTIEIFGLVVLIQFAAMGFNGWLQEINQAMVLPPFLKDFETMIRSMEQKAEEITEFLLSFTSFWQFLLVFVVVALIAGIGEELIFRGLIQRKLFLGTKNIHLAIFGAAFMFSAIHFQFYGFLPRLVLGMMFGYFYYWTQNLWVPIVAHVFNNGLAITVMYLNNLKITNLDLESMDDVPKLVVVLSFASTLGLMFYLRKRTWQEK
jgi:hypothetical protein